MTVFPPLVRRATFLAILALAIACALAPASWHPAAPALAQPATPVAANACEVPEPITRTGRPIASSTLATPVAVASPLASSLDPNTVAHLEQVVRAVAACQTGALYRTYAKLVTPEFLGAAYGGGDTISTTAFVQLVKELPPAPLQIRDITAPRPTANGASLTVTWVNGNQLLRGDWHFVWVQTESTAGDETGLESLPLGQWLLDAIDPLEPPSPPDSTHLSIRLTDRGYRPAKLETTGSAVVIDGRNEGTDDHELLVLRLADGATTAQLLSQPGPRLPDGVTVMGQITVPAGADGRIVLVDLTPGNYAIVDLLPNADGVPNLAAGMSAQLVIR